MRRLWPWSYGSCNLCFTSLRIEIDSLFHRCIQTPKLSNHNTLFGSVFSKTSTKILLKSCMTVKPDHEKLKLTNTIYICLNYIPKSYIKPEAHLVVIIISWSIIGWKNKNNLCTSELELGSHRTNYNKMNCELMLTYDTPALWQTGSRNLTGQKTLPTIWGTYMMLVTKYQIPVINSCLEKCDEKCAYTNVC